MVSIGISYQIVFTTQWNELWKFYSVYEFSFRFSQKRRTVHLRTFCDVPTYIFHFENVFIVPTISMRTNASSVRVVKFLWYLRLAWYQRGKKVERSCSLFRSLIFRIKFCMNGQMCGQRRYVRLVLMVDENSGWMKHNHIGINWNGWNLKSLKRRRFSSIVL